MEKGKLLTGECKKDVGRQLRDRNMQQAIGRFLPAPPPENGQLQARLVRIDVIALQESKMTRTREKHSC